jgi:hypothetical protein
MPVMMVVMVIAVLVMPVTVAVTVAVAPVGLGRRDPAGHHQPYRDAEREDQSFHRIASEMRVVRGSADIRERGRRRGLRRPASSRHPFRAT